MSLTKLYVSLSKGPVAPGPGLVASTRDPALVRLVVDGLYTNFTLEADEFDRLFDPSFVIDAPGLSAALAGDIRRQACRQWLGDAGDPREAECDGRGPECDGSPPVLHDD